MISASAFASLSPFLSSVVVTSAVPTSPSLRTTFRPLSITGSATACKQRSSFYYLEMACSTSSLYEVLGISIGANNQEIKSAYRKLARTCHPDVAAVDRKDSSADEFKKIHAAYSTLSDPEKRAVYDSKLFRRNNRPLTASYSGYRGRNWETDQCW
ncbi:hypothetical protein K2173_023330 [Erythroxylum novogranatense]|uniref:J domain-containing protein n=1 Tax=Erythroxylum novogranatense TaxID=1862640 RepID=A0AAV8TXV1_9ROSI|nr:hypothetical protein K2173_023330 [Erythroxylum novogranatense]